MTEQTVSFIEKSDRNLSITSHLNMTADMKASVLITLQHFEDYEVEDELFKQLLSRLRASFQIVFQNDIAQNPDIKEDITGIVAVSKKCYVTDQLLTTLPSVRVIASFGVGVDHIDLKSAKEKGIRVGNTRYVISDSTADLAITLILTSTRKILTSKWFYYSGSREDEDRVKATFYSRLHDMLPETDVLVIACPCTEQTMNLISTEEFRLMKKTSLLVEVVDTDALVKALQSNEIQSAALDVTEPEPLPRGHPLLSMPNVIITAHCGADTFETRIEMHDLLIENLKCGLEGKAMPSEVIL
ncbi:glyoxylate reductase/hydroxypyruvate reductase [Octopus bimaculoides]|nr:glyoxylate reductase/hydroxypyruvate reductase [Octopus bimaculoides]